MCPRYLRIAFILGERVTVASGGAVFSLNLPIARGDDNGRSILAEVTGTLTEPELLGADLVLAEVQGTLIAPLAFALVGESQKPS
mmetsp:Transcript_24346/g.47344  ORF Transcript_24346/g.47344 Transcript_24346/m.47344 type:complete len:85 (-) Transcript_24346:1338-1592(-)